MRHADRDQIRIAGELILVVEHDIDRDMAGEGQLAAIAYAHRLVGAEQAPVLVQPPERHLVDDFGSAGASLTMSPLRACTTCLMPDVAISEPCATRCTASPCTGTPICGRVHSYILRNSLRRGCPET